MEVNEANNHSEHEAMDSDIIPGKKCTKDSSKDGLCNGQDTDDSRDSQHKSKMNGKTSNGMDDHDSKDSADVSHESVDDSKDADDSKDGESRDADSKDGDGECQVDKKETKLSEKDAEDETKTDEAKSDSKDGDEEAKKDESKDEPMETDQDKTEENEEDKKKTQEEIEKEEERLKEEKQKQLEEKKQEEKRQKFKMLENLGNDTEDMRPMAGLLYSLGADLVKQHIFKDLLRVQTKKKAKNLLQSSEDQEQLESVKKTYDDLVEKNRRFSNSPEVCSRCQFKTESKNVMEWHLEFAHSTESNIYQCCFCEYYSKFPADFFFHVEQEHKRKGRIYMKPAFFCCALCPFEHNSKAALNKHKPKCEKNFMLKRNLEPSPTDCDIPLKKLKAAVTAKPKSAVQAPKAIVTTPAIAQPSSTTWQGKGAVRLPSVTPTIVGGQLPMPQMPVLQQKPTNPVVSQYTIGNNVYTLVNSQGQFMLHQAGGIQAGGVNRAPGVGMVAPTSLTSAGGNMVRLQVPILQVNNNQNTKSLLNNQTKTLIASQTPQKGKGNKSKTPTPPPANKAGQFEICEICGGFVKDRESLRIHFYWAHKVDINKELFDRKTPHLICEFCPQRFWTYQGYTRHRQMSHKTAGKEPVWKCPVCRQDGIDNLLTHLNQKHNISLTMICHQKYCPMCGLTFKNEPATKQHLLAAHKQMFEKAVAACVPSVSKVTSSAPVPTGLYKNAAKKYEPVCSLCDMTFPSIEAFTLHCAKMHLFRCYRCGQKWNTSELLQAHFRQAHSNEQEKCQICSSKLTIGRPYIRHVKRTHLKECSVVLVRLPKAQFDVYHKKYLENNPPPGPSPSKITCTVKAVVAQVLKNTQAVARKKTAAAATPMVIDLSEDEGRKKKQKSGEKKDTTEVIQIDGETILIEKQEDSDDEKPKDESNDGKVDDKDKECRNGDSGDDKKDASKNEEEKMETDEAEASTQEPQTSVSDQQEVKESLPADKETDASL